MVDYIFLTSNSRSGGNHTYLSPLPMEHLACFLPGNIALGSQFDAVDDQSGIAHDRKALLDLAERLTHTCIDFYSSVATGLSPESVSIDSRGKIRVSLDTCRPANDTVFHRHKIGLICLT